MSNPSIKIKLLYVDDDPILSQLVPLVLEQQGLQVQTASNGSEGVEKALAWLPDLILMDLTMPMMDGFQAAAALRADPRTRHIPIVALSGTSEAHELARVQELGMNGFILKSGSANDLIKTIQAYLPPKK
ncbi:MAG: response regulator [Anaerolineae bacterium]|nr:response regulator [Anaerolineae bacterium]